MEGLELVLKRGMSLNISTLFSGINLDCVIYVAQSEIIYKNVFIYDDCHMADCLVSAIRGQPYTFEGLIHKLVAFVFPKDTIPYDVPTYADYLKSECILALLVYDVNYIELYAKSQELLEKLQTNTSMLPVEQVDIKNAATESRTDFYV